MARKRDRERELEGVNLLGLAPVRTAEWEEDRGAVTVLRPRPSNRGLKGFLDRLFHSLSAQRIRLDDVGSFAWLHFDGQSTVGDVARLLREEFGERVEPAEERLGRLVQMMRREGFLAYPEWDEGA